jgi:hypothetical protein
MMNWKGRGRKSWPNFMVLAQHFPGGTEESTGNLSQERPSLGRDLNPGPPECEAGLLTARPRHSVKGCYEHGDDSSTFLTTEN